MTWSPSARGRRRVANALVAYGIIGIVILAVLAVGVGYATIRATTAVGRLASERDHIVRLLGETSAALASAQTATRGIGSSLTSAGTTLGAAATTTRSVAAGATNLTSIADLSILGQQPFAAFRGDLQRIAGDASALATSLDSTATSLISNTADTATLGQKLESISADVDGISDSIAALDLAFADALILVAVVILVLLLWLAIPAGVALWVGLRWRGRAPDA